MTKLLYSQMKPNEQKNCFQGIPHVFFASTLSFRDFRGKFEFGFEIWLIFGVLWHVLID